MVYLARIRRLSREPSNGQSTIPAAIAHAEHRIVSGRAVVKDEGRTDTDALRASFPIAVALTVVLAFAAFGVVMALVTIAIAPEPIPGLPASQRQNVETGLYVLAFAVILPLAVIAAPRLADRIAAGPQAPALPALTAGLWAGLAGSVVLAKLLDRLQGVDASVALLISLVVWWMVACVVLARAVTGGPGRPRLAGTQPVAVLWGVAGALALVAFLTTVELGSLSPLPLVLGAVGIPAYVLLAERIPRPRISAGWGAALDVLVVAVLLLAVVDLVFITPENPDVGALDRFRYAVMQFHQDFLIGPANQVLGGSALLVESASQYGVGSILFLAGWFKLVPIGYGTFALLDGILTALFFVAGYCILRMAGASRALSAFALLVGVVVLVLNRPYPIGGLPQEGPLRFGLPMALILVTVTGARWPRWTKATGALAFVILAVSSLWSFEAFALTLATFVALGLIEMWLRPPGGRLRRGVRQAGLAVAACVSAHLIFAGVTLAATGELPKWGQYLEYLNAFIFGDLGDITYDFTRWSPAVAVGGGYLASAAALLLLLLRRPGVARRESVALLALTGVTTYGILFFNYFVDRSADHVLAYVSLPLVLLAVIWLSLLFRLDTGSPRLRLGVRAFALATVTLALSVAWSSLETRFDDTALAHVFPGGPSTREAMDRLWNFPPYNDRSVQGEQLLDRYMPGQRRVLVLAEPSLSTEILVRSGRANRFFLGDPLDYDFVAESRGPGLRETVSELRSGERLLVDSDALAVLGSSDRRRSNDEAPKRPIVGSSLSRLQVFTLGLIDERFRLRPVGGADAMVVFELERRR